MKERNSKPRIDLTGMKFGRWTAIEYVKTGKWKCECSCDNHTIKIVDGRNLRAGKSQSCGCLQKEKTSIANSVDYTGMRFGKLLAKLRVQENGRTYYFCDCECGTTNIKVDGRNLKSGHTTSCGCIKSKGEFLIGKILSQHNIKYEKEKTFQDCKDINLLPFDFYLPEYDILIEYDGEQHFSLARFGNKTIEQAKKELDKYILHDNIKNNWCLKNNKKLLRYSYKDFNKLEELLGGELWHKE